MQNKKAESYKIILEHLKQTFPQFVVQECMRDFESALKKAVETVFPGVDVLGCQFHFGQVSKKVTIFIFKYDQRLSKEGFWNYPKVK